MKYYYLINIFYKNNNIFVYLRLALTLKFPDSKINYKGNRIYSKECAYLTSMQL
jgi:hypothetical protein